MKIVADCRRGAKGRLGKEEAIHYHPHHMDVYYDCYLLRLNVRGTHLHHNNRDGCTNYFVQGSYRHRKCSQPGKKSAFYKNTELVLLGNDNVLSLWRKCGVLFQAYHPD